MPTPPRLQPFKPTLTTALATALRAWLGVPANLPLQLVDDAPVRSPELNLRLLLGDGPSTLTLRLQGPQPAKALWSGECLSLSQVGPGTPEDRPLLHALVRRLQVLDKQGLEASPQRELLAALDQWRAFRPVPESEFATLHADELLLRLSFRCNQDCSFCWQDRQWPAPPLPVLEQWIDQAAAAGVRELVLSGGEPTLFADLASLVARGRRHGLDVSLQTNAIRLGQQPGYLADLVDHGLVAVVVSYHSPDAGLSDQMTRAPGTHRRTEAGIAACLQAGLQVTLNCVVDARNYADLPAHAEAVALRFGPLATHRPYQLTVAYGHPNAAFDRQAWPELVVPLDQLHQPLTQALVRLRQAGIVAEASGSCGFPLCALRDVPGHIPARDMALAPETARAGREKARACESCVLSGYCVGPRRTYLEQVGERGLVPFTTVPPGLGADLPAAMTAWWAPSV